MQIRWSPQAADDLENIVRHIQQDNPQRRVTLLAPSTMPPPASRHFRYAVVAGFAPVHANGDLVEISRI